MGRTHPRSDGWGGGRWNRGKVQGLKVNAHSLCVEFGWVHVHAFRATGPSGSRASGGPPVCQTGPKAQEGRESDVTGEDEGSDTCEGPPVSSTVWYGYETRSSTRDRVSPTSTTASFPGLYRSPPPPPFGPSSRTLFTSLRSVARVPHPPDQTSVVFVLSEAWSCRPSYCRPGSDRY